MSDITDLERGIRIGLEMAAKSLDASAAKKRRQHDKYPSNALWRFAEIEWCLSQAMRMRHLIVQSEKRPEVAP